MALPSENAFIGIDPATLAAMQTEYITAIREIATTGQGYTINGRTHTSADLPALKATLLEVNQAIAAANLTARPRWAVPFIQR